MTQLVAHHALGAVGGLVIVLSVARLVSVEALGRFLVAQSLAFLLVAVLGALLGKGVVLALRDAPDRRAAGSRFIQLYGAAGLLTSAFLLLFSLSAADPFNDRALMTLLAVMSAYPGIEIGLSGYRNYLSAEQRYSAIPRATFFRWAVHIPLSIVLLFMWRSEVGVGVSLVVSATIELGVLAWVCRLPLRSGYRLPRDFVASLIAPAFLASSASHFLKNLDLLLTKALIASGAAAGLYGAAKSFGNLGLLLAYALGTVVMVEVRGRAASDRAGVAALTGWAYRVLIVAALGVPFLSLFGGPLLVALLGPEYLAAASLLAPVLLGSLFLGVVSVNSGVAMGLNLMWPLALIVIPFPILAGVAYWAILPAGGLEGVVGVFLVTSALAAVASFGLLHRLAGVRLPVRTTVIVGAASGIAMVLGRQLPTTGPYPWIGMVAFLLAALFTLHVTGEIRSFVEAPDGGPPSQDRLPSTREAGASPQ